MRVAAQSYSSRETPFPSLVGPTVQDSLRPEFPCEIPECAGCPGDFMLISHPENGRAGGKALTQERGSTWVRLWAIQLQ